MSQAPASGSTMDRRVERPGRAGRRRLIRGGAAAAAAALALLVWWWLPSAGSVDVALADVQLGDARRAPFEDVVPTRAMVAPQLTTLVGVVQGGQVERLLVQDGATVTAGQALATLANPQLRLDVLTREAQIASQLGQLSAEDLGLERGRRDRDAQVAGADYDLIKARRDLAVRQQLHQGGFLSDAGLRSYQEEAAYQQKRSGRLHMAEGAERSIAGLQARRLAETRARLSTSLAAVRDGLDALTLRAPASGRLTNFVIQPGQSLKPGDPAGQVDSEGAWKLVADVDQYFLGRVAVGQPGTADGGVRLVVRRVLPAVTDGRFRVELDFRRPPAGLNRGQAMDARIVLGSPRPAVVVPLGGWLDGDAGAFAYVLDASGRHAVRRAVRVGRRNADTVEILSGLSPGERIVTSQTAGFNNAVTINLK